MHEIAKVSEAEAAVTSASILALFASLVRPQPPHVSCHITL
jgi:hypothetical protein